MKELRMEPVNLFGYDLFHTNFELAIAVFGLSIVYIAVVMLILYVFVKNKMSKRVTDGI